MKKFLALLSLGIFLSSPAFADFAYGTEFGEGDISLAANSVVFYETTDPATPSADYIELYAKDDGGTTKLYTMNSSGVASAVVTGSGAAPTDATYITQTANGSLSAEQALSSLATGYVKNTTGTGVLSTQAVPIPVADGGTATTTAFTAGSVVFAGASGVYSQDNGHLYYDDTNDRLMVNTNTMGAPVSQLYVGDSATAVSRVGVNSSGNSGFGLYVGGAEKWINVSYQANGGNYDYVVYNQITGTNSLLIDGDTNSISIDQGFIANESGSDSDTRFEGDTDQNTFYLDASTDRIGIGTATPGSKLDVAGSFQANSIQDDSLTQGSIIFAGASGLHSQDNSSFFWDDSSDNLRLGPTINTALTYGNDKLALTKNSDYLDFNMIVASSDVNQVPVISLTKSRGTLSSPTDLQNNDRIGLVSAKGMVGNSDPAAFAEIRFEVNGSVSTTSSPGRILFLTTPSGSLTDIERLRVDSNGAVTINEEGNDSDVRMEGDTDANTFYLDASTDRLGVGVATPGSKLDVAGSFQCDSITNDTGLAAGVYTPTRSSETNLDSNVTMSEAQYMRVGNTVTVSGRFTADPTTTLTPSNFEITLPVASNIGAIEDAAGIAAAGGVAGQVGAINGVVANDTAQIEWNAVDTTSQIWSYQFSYQVI